MPNVKPKKLKNIRLKELSLVKAGANQGSRVAIFKSDLQEFEQQINMDALEDDPEKVDQQTTAALALRKMATERLDMLAKQRSETTGEPYHRAYMTVLDEHPEAGELYVQTATPLPASISF